MLASLVAAALLTQGPGFLTAYVNDPQSHGVVGDSLLSLDEAIRLTNGTLLLAALSPAEQARVLGTGTLFDTIRIDAAATPVITLQAPLSDVLGALSGPMLIIGDTSGAMVRPTIQGGGQLRVFTLRAHGTMLHGLRVVGGQVGVDVRMAHVGTANPEMSMLMECELEGQTVAGVHVHGSGTDESWLMVLHTHLHAMPLGFLLTDQTTGGHVMVEGEHVVMDQVVRGCSVLEGGAGGAMSMFMLFRSHFTNGQTLAVKRRTAPGSQMFMFRLVHTDATCSGDVLDIEGSPTGLTMVHHHHGDFVAGPGQKALHAWPRTSFFDIHGSEMRFVGDVSIATNLATLRVWQQNNRYENGTVTYDVDGALPNLQWNQYVNCSVVVPALARSPVVLRSCELVGTPVNSASFLAPVTLQGSYRSGGSLAGFASEVQPAPTAFLGRTSVTPTEPQIGGTLTLAADLPFGMGLVWDVADSYSRPTTTAEPFRLYGDPATLVVLPIMVLFQSQVVVPIPNAPTLVGLEFYAQGIALPLVAMPHAPPFHLPRGGLIRPRL